MNIKINHNRELNEQELRSVNGGCPSFIVEPDFPGERYFYVHNHCGGRIKNVGKLFEMCRCSKCGEEHYSIFSFDCSEYEVKHLVLET